MTCFGASSRCTGRAGHSRCRQSLSAASTVATAIRDGRPVRVGVDPVDNAALQRLLQGFRLDPRTLHEGRPENVSERYVRQEG